MRDRCCIVGCNSRRKYVHFYKFPKTEKGVELWLKSISKETLRNLNFNNLCKNYVCQKHFEQRFIKPTQVRSRLDTSAYPSLFSEIEIRTGVPQTKNKQLAVPNKSAQEHSYAKCKMHIDHTYSKDFDSSGNGGISAFVELQRNKAVENSSEKLSTTDPIKVLELNQPANALQDSLHNHTLETLKDSSFNHKVDILKNFSISSPAGESQTEDYLSENLSPRVSSPRLEETPDPVQYFAPFGDVNEMDDVEVPPDGNHDAWMKASFAEMSQQQEQLQSQVLRLRTELHELQDLKKNQILETENLHHLINKTMEVLTSSSKENGMLRGKIMELELELEQLRDQVTRAENRLQLRPTRCRCSGP